MTAFVIIVTGIIRGLMAVVRNVDKDAKAVKRLSRLRIRKASDLIASNFIDSKQLFVQVNKELPNVTLINGIDVNKATQLIDTKLGKIKAVYRHRQFDFTEQQVVF